MSTAPRVDAAQLLDWLDSHGQDGPAVRCAIYAGLAERIRRGDFTPAEQPRTVTVRFARVAPAAEPTGVQPEGS